MASARVRTFRDLLVWKQAFELCLAAYRATDGFPTHERFGLSGEIRKTVRSVVYNIAEGHRRRSTIEFLRFLDISRGSAAELETQFLLAQALSYLDAAGSAVLMGKLGDIDRMLTALMQKLREKGSGSARRAPALP